MYWNFQLNLVPFGPDASVYVFGSRVDDSARGGDIDLLIRLEKPQVETERKILRVVARLQIRLGDQPIDVLLQDPESIPNRIHLEAPLFTKDRCRMGQ